MNKEIKIKDKTFKFNLPNVMDNPTLGILNDWCKLVDQQKNKEDVWTTIPQLPQYKFKNLRVESYLSDTVYDANEITVTFKCDEFETI